MPAPRRATRRASSPTAALFVRIPTEQARRLDQAAFALGRPKQELVSSLLERYLDSDSPKSLTELGAEPAGTAADRRRVTIETLEPGAFAVGHHSFRPRDPEVLTPAEAAELLQIDVTVVEALAQANELPARLLGGEWRISRRALLDWLAAASPDVAAGEPGPSKAAPGPSDRER